MYQLPETGFLRLSQIIGNPNADPPVLPIIPIKKSCWWAGVKTGRFPRPVKLGRRVTVWRVEDIRQMITSTAGMNDTSLEPLVPSDQKLKMP